MKKVFFACLVVSFCVTAFAQQNVGIGTSSPAYRLDVVGRVRVQASTLNDPFSSPGIWYTDYRNNANIAFIGMADSVNYGFWGDRPNVGWQFYFDTRYGNVGIGRKPSSGTNRLTLDHPSGASISMYANGAYRGGFQATDSTIEIVGAYRPAVCVNCEPAKNIILWPPSSCFGIGCLVPSPGRIGMYTNTPQARLHIVSGTGASGVLISSSSSTEPATGYMLNVDGKIICEELRVQLNTAWPDYVFEPGYQLADLDALEQQVKKTGHLPGILPASAVHAEGGVELGEMQRKMLEKMEELYLYVFELNKENKALKAEIAKTKKRR